MSPLFATAAKRPTKLLLGVFVAFALSALPGTAMAQIERNPVDRSQSESSAAPEARTADDEFSRQLNELKKTFADLSKKIDDSAQSMGRTGNAETARKEIEDLRA